jgi:hypothetical protein
MLRNPTVSEVAVAEPTTHPRWQVFLLGLAIALLFYLALALITSAPHGAFDAGAVGAGEPAIWRTFSWGGTNPGQTHYTLTIYGDRSLELVWDSVEAVAAGGANTGAWVNSRMGSLCFNCD